MPEPRPYQWPNFGGASSGFALQGQSLMERTPNLPKMACLLSLLTSLRFYTFMGCQPLRSTRRTRTAMLLGMPPPPGKGRGVSSPVTEGDSRDRS